MTYKKNHLSMSVFIFSFFLLFSCAKDSDFFLDAVLETPEEIVDEITNSEENSNRVPAPAPPNTTNTNKIEGTYYPESAAEMADASKTNFKAIITKSFNCSNCTLAPNQTIEPAGGIISGTRINLNGAYLINNNKQVFSANSTFSELYGKSRLSPEIFGGFADDNIADDQAIVTLINNSFFATATVDGVYIKNAETIHDRNGLFDWELNNAIIRTTSANKLSHGPTVDNAIDYLFDIRNLDLRIVDGKFDGQDLASRLFYLRGVHSYHLENIIIENYYAPRLAFARGVALKIDIDNDFTGGKLLNSTIRNIGAASDGNANNSPFGVAKGLYYGIGSQNSSEQLVQGCTIENIYGDDAEGVIITPAYGFNGYVESTNKANLTFNDNTFKACQRRAFKINASNVQLNNNLIESATNDWLFSGAQAALIHIFPISPQEPIYNVSLKANTIKIIGDARNSAFGITECKNCVIENNKMQANYILMQRSAGFGNGSNSAGPNSGYFDNTVIFKNNILTNIFILLDAYFIPTDGGPIFENNTINLVIDRGMGGSWGAIRRAYPSRGDITGLTFKDFTINVNQSVASGESFGGVILSEASNLKNVTFDNVDINYTGNAIPKYPFARIGTNNTGNFDATNTIIDCEIKGAVGTGSIRRTGVGAPIIKNSTGENNTPITLN